MNKLYCAFFVLIVLVSCAGTKFTSSSFDAKTSQHKQIAILPFRVVYTGKVPKKLTPNDIEKLRYAEAAAFQKSLYTRIIRQSGTNKKDIKIEIQSIEKTNQLLKEEGLQYLVLDTTMSQELCKKLGVDAVVYASVEKERFLANLEPFGLAIAQDVLDRLNWGNSDLNDNLPQIPGNASRTYRIKTDCLLKNGVDGALLWKYAININADWKLPANEVIESVASKFSKHFPYRNP